jgi:hypothetical protein
MINFQSIDMTAKKRTELNIGAADDCVMVELITGSEPREPETHYHSLSFAEALALGYALLAMVKDAKTAQLKGGASCF